MIPDDAVPVPSEPRLVYECVDPSLGCVNPYDTQVSADITFSVLYTATLSTSFLDPVSGQYTNVLTVNPPDLHVHVDAGYMTNGSAKITTSYSDGADQSTTLLPQVIRQDLTGNRLTDINPLGYALTNTSPDSMSATPVMSLVGSTTNGSITAGILVDLTDTVTVSGSLAPALPPQVKGRLIPQAAAVVVPTIRPAAAFAAADQGTPTVAVFNGASVRIRKMSSGVLSVADVNATTANNAGTGGTNPSSGQQHVRTFHRSGTAWVIDEDRSVSDESTADGHRHTEHVLSYSNVHWKRNLSQDSLRLAARPSRDWMPLPPESATGTGAFASVAHGPFSAPKGPSALIACDDQCVGGSVPTGPSPLGSA